MTADRDDRRQRRLARRSLAERAAGPGVSAAGRDRWRGRHVAIVDVHGGAWASRNRTLGERYNVAVAGAGFTVVAIDFRDGRNARHPAAVDDVAAAVRWTRANAAELGIDAGPVALMGSSSGGHLALHAALTQVEVPFVAAFWPPVDPHARYRYAHEQLGRPVPDGQRFDAAGLVASTEAYFGDEATMAAASISTLVGANTGRALPEVWLVQAGADLNVPAEMIDRLVEDYRRAGGKLERSVYPGEVHGFGHAEHDAASRFRTDLIDRLTSALAVD